MGLADSPHFLRFVREMVREPAGSVKQWADASGTPQTPAYRIVRFFRFHGALARGPADVRRVLRLAADLRKDRAMPTKSMCVENPYELLAALSSVHHQLAYQSAANQLAHFEPTDLHVRVDRHEPLEPLTWPGVQEEPGSRRVQLHLYVDELSRFPEPHRVENTTITDPIITLMDLYSHPRAGAHAEFLDGVLVEAGLLPERTR